MVHVQYFMLILTVDQYSPLMALCASKTESKGQIETARLLINRGAVVNSHDRYGCGVV